MDFFLDTGIFIGICDFADDYYPDCKRLFDDYPLNIHNYYSCKKVEIELDKKRRERRRRKVWIGKRLRSIEQCIRLRLSQMKRLVEYEITSTEDFEPICEAVASVVGFNYNDACIVSNALIWSYDIAQNNPTLVTVDYADISSKKDRIIEQAELRRAYAVIPLEIKAVWDM